MALTLVAYQELAYNVNSTSRTFTSITWSTGDLVVIIASTGDQATTLNTPTVTGLTFTGLSGFPQTAASNCYQHAWQATAASASSGTVQITSNGGPTQQWGAGLWEWSGHNGVGTIARSQTGGAVASVSMAISANSAVIGVKADWNNITASYTGTPTVNVEREDAQWGPDYQIWSADWLAQAAGTRNYGATTTSGTKDTLGFVEIKEAGGAISGQTDGTSTATGDLSTSHTPQTYALEGSTDGVATAAGFLDTPLLVKEVGFVTNTTSATTSLVAVAAGGVPIGDFCVAFVAVDNSGTSGALPGLTVTDPRSNTWTVETGQLNDPGAASAGAAAYIAWTRVTTALVAADNITFTWGTAATAKGISVQQFEGLRATSTVATSGGGNNTATSPSTGAVTPTRTGQLACAVVACEGPTTDTFTQDTDTVNGAWVGLTNRGSGTTQSAMTCYPAYKQISTTGTPSAQTYNPTLGTTSDTAAKMVIFNVPLLWGLDGSSDGTSTTTGDLTVSAGAPVDALEGQSDGTSSTTGAINVAVTLASTTGIGSSTTTGALAVARTLASTDAAGTSTTTGALAVARGLTSTTGNNGTSTTTGALAVARGLASTTANGASTTTGALIAAVALNATSGIGTSTTTGALAVARSLAATSGNGSSTTTGAVVVAVTLASTTANGSSTTTGTLTTSAAGTMTGTANGASTVTGALTVARTLVGTSDGVSSTTGVLAVGRAFASTTANGVSTTTGTLIVNRALAASSANGLSTATAVKLIATLALVGASSGTSTTTGALATAGVAAKYWNGTTFVAGPVKVWNGTAFVSAVAIRVWNGTAWV